MVAIHNDTPCSKSQNDLNDFCSFRRVIWLLTQCFKLLSFLHIISWVWVVSQKDRRNQTAGWIQAMHWYSIWVKMRFLCFSVLQGSAEAQVIWGGIVICFWLPTLSVTFLPKEYQNPFPCLKDITIQRWDIFLRHGVVDLIWHLSCLCKYLHVNAAY